MAAKLRMINPKLCRFFQVSNSTTNGLHDEGRTGPRADSCRDGIEMEVVFSGPSLIHNRHPNWGADFSSDTFKDKRCWNWRMDFFKMPAEPSTNGVEFEGWTFKNHRVKALPHWVPKQTHDIQTRRLRIPLLFLHFHVIAVFSRFFHCTICSMSAERPSRLDDDDLHRAKRKDNRLRFQLCPSRNLRWGF